MRITLPVIGRQHHPIPTPEGGWQQLRDPHCRQQLHHITTQNKPNNKTTAAIRTLKQLRGDHSRYSLILPELAKTLSPHLTELLNHTQQEQPHDTDANILAIHTSIITTKRSYRDDQITLELLRSNQSELAKSASFVTTYLTLSLGAGHPADERYTAFNIAYEQHPNNPHEAHHLLNTLRPTWGGNLRRLHSFAHDISQAASPGSPIKSVIPAALQWSRQPVDAHERHWNTKAQRHLEAALVSSSQNILEHWQNHNEPSWHEIHQLYGVHMHHLGYRHEAQEHLRHAGPTLYRYLQAHISQRRYRHICRQLNINYANEKQPT